MKINSNKRPNILFLMSDQHNAGSMGCAGHPNVKTPNLDGIASRGVRFTRAYCNNPICAPSRISFVSGQYCHTHRVLGNDIFEMDDENKNTLGCTLRRHGYQTAFIGKGHMISKWDNLAYERIRYCDLSDASRKDPRTNHYFKYLVDNGIADMYEDGALPPEHETNTKGCAVAGLPYEHGIERWTGNETLEFLKTRDRTRPFFAQMSFERPHPNWMPAREHADMYNPEDIELGPDAADWWENGWAGRPGFIAEAVKSRMSGRSIKDLKKMLACHFALVTVIDMEIGRVLNYLGETGELENTIIIYTADHGDFAGDHGICNKNIGIYESIHRIPFIISYPGGPRGAERGGIIESVDVFPSICELADVPAPGGLDGRSLLPELAGEGAGRPHAICEWRYSSSQMKVNALRTGRYRLVYYSREQGGELYDHEKDPYEMFNRWDDPSYKDIRLELLETLFDRVSDYDCKSTFAKDRVLAEKNSLSPTYLIHKKCRKWSEFKRFLEDGGSGKEDKE